MSEIVIKVENLGKLYKLGEISTGTISHDLKRWWALARGKEDPFAKIGSTNDRTVKGDSDYVWALKDVNFEVKKGEALGIIGRNGAGKSTLLKLLSKVTTPSAGSIKVKGRIASLLEVGTGFHPELTGRENIFLNGAILGMTKAEIRSKFDEIVDFSGVERYIDTPVKRYSSGMYVRLAFAVAAHLEPEILIVDEVLAVGDSEFQNKCLGKMKDVSEKGGRAVLFVSHNMGAISTLCTSCLLLKNGTFKNFGPTEKIISEYMRIGEGTAGISEDNSDAKSEQKLKIRRVRILNDLNKVISEIDNSRKVFIEISFDVLKEGKGYDLSFELSHSQYGIIFGSSLKDTNLSTFSMENLSVGRYTYRIELPVDYLRAGDYLISVSASIPKVEILDIFKYETEFSLIDSVSPVAKTTEGRQGVILPIIKWNKVI